MRGGGCLDDNTLAALIDSSLDDADRLAVETHLDACAACNEVATQLAWVIAAPRDSPARYRLQRITERGWLAVDVEQERPVEIRFSPRGRDGAERLERVRAGARLRQIGLVPILDAGVFDAELYIVCSADVVRDAMPVRSLDAWRQAATSVKALHDAGLPHGALEPCGLVATSSGILVDRLGEPARPTSGYVAPELLAGAPPTTAADQFALCAIAWELVTGERPFRGATIGSLAVEMASRPRPVASDPTLRVLARGLDPDPSRRWPDLDALEAALTRHRSHRGVFKVLVACLVAAAAGLGLYLVA